MLIEFKKGADDRAEIFLDGNRVCPDVQAGANQPFTCELGKLKSGKAMLEIKVIDNSGDGGINGDIVLKADNRPRLYDVELLTPKVSLKQCGKAEVRYLVVNHLGSAAHGTLLNISPPETWKWLPQSIEFDLPSFGKKEISVPVSVPEYDPVTNTWLLGKFLIDGQLIYSETAELVAGK
jgi:hypothetical protein